MEALLLRHRWHVLGGAVLAAALPLMGCGAISPTVGRTPNRAERGGAMYETEVRYVVGRRCTSAQRGIYLVGARQEATEALELEAQEFGHALTDVRCHPKTDGPIQTLRCFAWVSGPKKPSPFGDGSMLAAQLGHSAEETRLTVTDGSSR